MRRAAKVDDNQSEIVAAYRKQRAHVALLHQVGGGVGDLLVAFPRRCPTCETLHPFNHFLEVKDGSKPKPKQKLTPDEAEFHAAWKHAGGDIKVVSSIEAALRAIGIETLFEQNGQEG